MRKAAIMFLLLLSSVNVLYAQNSAQVSATVSVGCPFYVMLGVQPTYPKIGNIPINYTVHSQGACITSSLTGNIIVDYGSNTVMSNAISISNIGSSPETFNTLLGTNALANGTYSVTVSLSASNIQNSSTEYFQLLNPTNIIITGISTQPSIQLGSQSNIEISLKNRGQYASTGSTLFLSVNGPAAYSNSYNMIGLSPGQEANTTLAISGITGAIGTYTISVYDQYQFNSVNYDSAAAEAAYTVYQPRSSFQGSTGGVIEQSITPVSPIQNFVLEAAPFLISASSSSPAIALLESVNTGSSEEAVNFSVPKGYSNLVKLSTSSIDILPKQSLSIQILISPNATIGQGIYIVPVNISVNSDFQVYRRQSYMVLNIYKPSRHNLQAINFVSLANYSSSADGVIQINNPSASNVSNATLQTLLPASLISNASQISAKGLPSSITQQPGFYVINWQIPLLKGNSSSFAYYSIKSPSSAMLLDKVQNVLMQPYPANRSILDIINTQLPIFYTNSSGELQVEALYTGTKVQQVNFSLSSAQGLTIRNASQSINVNPNQLISPAFGIVTSKSSGTFLVNVNIATNGYDTEYQIPLLVLSNQPAQQPAQQAAPAPSLQGPEAYAIAAASALIILSLIILIVKGTVSKPKYLPDRAERLVRLREQIKRNNSDEK